jgi:hypothetical protein
MVLTGHSCARGGGLFHWVDMCCAVACSTGSSNRSSSTANGLLRADAARPNSMPTTHPRPLAADCGLMINFPPADCREK